jgi:transposase
LGAHTVFIEAAERTMKRFIEGEDRSQSTLFPEHLDDYIAEDNPVRVIDVFVDELDLSELGFEGMAPEVTGRPAYHPASLLKIYIYGYLNRVQSSRRLERETQRNIELIWLTGRLMPDFKTIADFRKDNGKAIRRVCREFIVLCRDLKLFSEAIVAIDGSKFKAVNNRDKNFTDRKLKARMQQLDDSIARYMTELDRADREPALVTEARVEHIKEKMQTVKKQMRELKQIGKQMAEAPDGQISLTDPDARSMATSGRGTGMVGYNVQTAARFVQQRSSLHPQTPWRSKPDGVHMQFPNRRKMARISPTTNRTRLTFRGASNAVARF